MFQLSEGEKIIVLAVCLGLVVLTVVLTVCAVVPSCWLYGFLHRLAKKRKMKYMDIDGFGEGAFIKMNGTPHYTVECGPASQLIITPFTDGLNNVGKGLRKREDSTYSSMSSSSQGNASVSNYTDPSIDSPINDCDQDVCHGLVTFSVYCRSTENVAVWQLIVVLKEAEYLPPRLYGGTCDPYLVLHLFREKGKKRWSKSSSTPIYEFRTPTIRKSQHPLYRKTCVMEVSKADLREDSLKIAVFDDEKYANDSELGEVTVPLKDIPFCRNGEEIVLTRYFLEPKQELGELLFGLSYLPTAERLTFNIVKANNLKVITDDTHSFAPFIRILLMLNEKVVKKKKTSVKPGTASPVFNESLTFDVPPDQLDHVIFLLVASHRDAADGAISSPDSPTTPQNASSKKKRHVGKVVIGTSVRRMTLNHWNAMKQSPRKQVTQWHNLR